MVFSKRILLIALFALQPFQVLFASEVPVEHFTRSPSYQNVTISPSGKFFASTFRNADFQGVAILNRETLAPVAAQQYGEDAEIFELNWASDDVLLVSPGIRLPGRTDFVFPTGEIMAFNVKSQRSKLLYGFRAGQTQTGSHLKKRDDNYEFARVVDALPGKPNHVLIETQPFLGGADVSKIQRIDVRNGRLKSLAKSDDRRSRFVTDLKGDVALRVRYDGKNEAHVEVKQKSGYLSISSSFTADGFLEPWYAAPGGGFYAFDDRSADVSSVVMMQPDGTTKVLHSRANRQPEQFLASRSGEVWGVRYSGVYPEYYYPNAKHPVALMHQRLRKTFPTSDVVFTSYTDDNRYITAFVYADQNPGMYYLIDLEKGGLVELLEARPWLKEVPLREMQPVEIKVRDDQKVIAMLTLPPSSEEKPPAVVLVHGGPHGVHDRWGYNSTVQLLASRGYAVLQVNFRGSGGYGGEFLRAGLGEWGGLMQQDVTDATRWLVASGSINPKKICIMGGSFGAYSALTGSFQQPDLYQCAIGYAGVYDLPLIFEKGDIRTTVSGVNYLRDTLGNDLQELRNRSPVFNTDKIKAKVFLAHGGLDQRAPPAHAKRLRKQLQESGNDPQWFFLGKEGHGFSNPENRASFYQEVIGFLDKSLK